MALNKTSDVSADSKVSAHHESFMAKSLLSRNRNAVSDTRRRGRGAGLNPSSRFEVFSRDVFDDDWQTLDDLPAFKTQVQVENSRSVITRNTSPDLHFDRSINAYRGCEHGCIYCYARPTHAYMGLSAGLDFESKLFVKQGAAKLLLKELSRKSYTAKTIALGTNTDPYQPIEKDWRVTREILEVLEKTNHPVAIITKSHLVTRDIDILERMAKKNLVRIAISITTLDKTLSRAMEPRAATPALRLKTIHELKAAGIPTSVTIGPVIPALNDHEIERILESAKSAGADEASYILLRLPGEVSPLFRDWLLREYPDRYNRVLNLLHSMRGGKDYDAKFGERMRGNGPYAWQIGNRFEIACRKIGLNRECYELNAGLFVSPAKEAQLNLF